jgi:hypothetical protein
MSAKRFIWLIVFSPLYFFAQTHQFSELSFKSTDSIKGTYHADKLKKFIYVTSKFGSDEVKQLNQLDSISSFFISKIVLVYSEFHKAEKFNQAHLNLNRWQNLYKTYPSFFNTGLTSYQNVCQYGIKTDSVAKKLTHGFYVYYENRSDPVVRKREINEIHRLLEKLGVNANDTAEVESATSSEVKKTEDSVSTESIAINPSKSKKSKFKKPMRAKDPRACRQPFYQTGKTDLSDFFKENIQLTEKQLRKRNRKKLEAEIRLQLEYNGAIRYADISSTDQKLIAEIGKVLSLMGVWNPAVKNGITIKSEVKFKIKCTDADKMELLGEVYVPKTLAKCAFTPDEELFDFSPKKVIEKVIPEVFEVDDAQLLRNVIERNPALDSLLVVLDLTGSMGPYIAQVLDLMSELVVKNNPCVTCVSLFNDGNLLPDKDKKIGATGGIIILSKDVNLDNLGKSIMKSMRRGDGGDCPENNLEAVLTGEQKCQSYKDILLIADNWASPRDGGLVVKLSRPVHWVLCGVEAEINCDYLDLVRENKGVLHTNKSDVLNLHLMKENERISIDGVNYKLVRNRFRLF